MGTLLTFGNTAKTTFLIEKHYEQQCNAQSLANLGVTVLPYAGKDFSTEIKNWLEAGNIDTQIKASNIYETLNFLLDNYTY